MFLYVVAPTYIFATTASSLALNLLAQLFSAHLTKAFYLLKSAYNLILFAYISLLIHPILAMNEKTITSNLHRVSISYLLQRVVAQVFIAKQQSIAPSTNKLILYECLCTMFVIVIIDGLMVSFRPYCWNLLLGYSKLSTFTVRLTRLSLKLKIVYVTICVRVNHVALLVRLIFFLEKSFAWLTTVFRPTKLVDVAEGLLHLRFINFC